METLFIGGLLVGWEFLSGLIFLPKKRKLGFAAFALVMASAIGIIAIAVLGALGIRAGTAGTFWLVFTPAMIILLLVSTTLSRIPREWDIFLSWITVPPVLVGLSILTLMYYHVIKP